MPTTFRESTFAATINEMIRGLQFEVDHARSDPNRSFELWNGSELHAGTQYIYRFSIPVDPPLPPETRVTISTAATETVEGRIVSIEDFEIILETNEPLVGSLREGKLSTEPWFIQLALAKRLESMLDAPVQNPEMLASLFGAAAPKVSGDMVAGSLPLNANASQTAAVQSCIASGLHFVWGPPGTGKTSNLAQTVRALIDVGDKVLVVAHSNAAVDVATLRIVETFADSDALDDGRILRAGTPQLEQVRRIHALSPEYVAGRSTPEVFQRKSELQLEIKSLLTAMRNKRAAATMGQLSALRNELSAINATLREGVSRALQAASVVTATLSRLCIDPAVWDLAPEDVLVDETSMASIAFTFMAAHRAQKRLSCFGDFRQLPPVVGSSRSEAQMWLGQDAFATSGVRAKIDSGGTDHRVSMLDVQYRMAEPIGGAVSQFAYAGKLRNHSSVRDRTMPVVDARPFPGTSITLVDTAALKPVLDRDPRFPNSRVNYLHAVVGAALANTNPAADVAVITPYRAQARFSMQLLRAISAKHARAATIHRFQGSEADVVIFDLVDALPEQRSSKLTGGDPDLSLRLMNVAISRARGTLIVLFDGRFVRLQPETSSIRMLLNALESGSLNVSVRQLQSEIGDSAVITLATWDQTEMVLLRDLEIDPSTPLMLNIPAGIPVGDALLASIIAHCRTRPTTIACGPDLAYRLENTDLDVRLRLSSGGFAASLGCVAYVGSDHPDGYFARLGVPVAATLLPNPSEEALIRVDSHEITLE